MPLRRLLRLRFLRSLSSSTRSTPGSGGAGGAGGSGTFGEEKHISFPFLELLAQQSDDLHHSDTNPNVTFGPSWIGSAVWIEAFQMLYEGF